MNKTLAIIEIGSNNTKIHIYQNDKVLYDTTTTIEFKKNYAKEGKILEEDLNKLYKVIEQVKNYTDNIYVYGCTNINAINYNSNANRDDGSCILKIYGCTDEKALNYDSNANVDDGSCIAKVLGCMDKTADNYNEKANTSNGKCLYTTTKKVTKKIKYKTVYKFSLFKNGKVYKKGKNGKKEITYKITKNEKNEIVSKDVVSKKTLVKKVDKVIYTNNIRKIG